MTQNGDPEVSKFRLRSYQEEMLEAAVQGNVIVKASWWTDRHVGTS
jgi:hypothetical protein